jgi:hypothetical protein
MDVNDVKATIRAGSHAAKNGAKTLAKAASDAADAERLARQTIYDSQDKNAQKALDKLTEVAQEVKRTLRRFEAAVEHADAYIRAIG